MDNIGTQAEVLLHVRQHLFAHRHLHLMRHTGHTNQQFARLVLLKRHDRRTTYAVRQDSCRLGYKPLRGSQTVEHVGTVLVQVQHMLVYALILNELRMEVVAQDGLGYIVLCRSQTAGGQYHIRTRHGCRYRVGYSLPVVANRCDLHDGYACVIEHLCHP